VALSFSDLLDNISQIIDHEFSRYSSNSYQVNYDLQPLDENNYRLIITINPGRYAKYFTFFSQPGYEKVASNIDNFNQDVFDQI
jgi:hypothetical protein